LGLRLEVDRQGTARLRFTPCLPREWPTMKVHYRYLNTLYHITMTNGGAGTRVTHVTTDGKTQADLTVALKDDGQSHDVAVQVT
ncbi:MAG: hypothetical protein ABJA82_05650, partial [Myxococcales bacterium]